MDSTSNLTKKTKNKPLDQRIAEALTDRKILHFRYDAHLRKQVMQTLNRTQKELIGRISSASVDALPKRQLDKLLKELKAKISEDYAQLSLFTGNELGDFFYTEAGALQRLYNEAVQFDLFNRVPEYKLKANQTAQIIHGAPLEVWWDKQSADLRFKFEALVRQGILDGKTTPQIVSEVRDLMNVSKRYSETLVITAVAKVADAAHEALRDENADLVKGERHLSTLDLRTSEICAARDGLVWDLDKKPINHKVPYARPPLHPRCRSILQLVLKSWRELGF